MIDANNNMVWSQLCPSIFIMWEIYMMESIVAIYFSKKIYFELLDK